MNKSMPRFAPLARPAVFLMSRMRLPTKLAFVAALALIPLIYFALHALSLSRDAINSTQAELSGSKIIGPAVEVLLETQTHRGQANQKFGGSTTIQPALVQTMERLSKALESLDQVMKRYPEFALQAGWLPAREALLRYSQGALPPTAAESFKQHSDLIAATQMLIDLTAEKSGLLLEPEAEPYFTMILAVERMVPWMEAVGQIRGLSTPLILSGTADANQRLAMMSRLEAHEQIVAAAQVRFRSLERAGGALPADLQGTLDASTVFIDETRRIFKAEAVSGNAADYFSMGSATINRINAIEKELLRRLDSVLSDRLKSQTQNFYISAGMVLFGVSLTIYLMLGFYLNFMGAMHVIQSGVIKAASGDLTARFQIQGKDELGETAALLEQMVASLSIMVANVRNSSTLVAQSGAKLTEGTGDLASRTNEQAASLGQTATALTELTAGVVANAETAKAVDKLASDARMVVESSEGALQAAVVTMQKIQADAAKVQEIITLIDGIAFQTNILALNAAVEAARAGEEGRGFAVVASEVRHLAQRSAAAAKEIKTLLDQSALQVSAGVIHVSEVNAKMDGVVVSIREVANNMRDIAAATMQQSAGLEQISAAIGHLDDITHDNNAMVETARSNAGELEARAMVLSETASAFHLRQGVAEDAQKMVLRAVALHSRHGNRTLQLITEDKEQQFADRDMYVFAMDNQGRYEAFAGQPGRVGRSLAEVPGVNVRKLLDDAFSEATDNGGWVDYELINPISGKIEQKTTYVKKLSATSFLGCGIYRAA